MENSLILQSREAFEHFGIPFKPEALLEPRGAFFRAVVAIVAELLDQGMPPSNVGQLLNFQKEGPFDIRMNLISALENVRNLDFLVMYGDDGAVVLPASIKSLLGSAPQDAIGSHRAYKPLSELLEIVTGRKGWWWELKIESKSGKLEDADYEISKEIGRLLFQLVTLDREIQGKPPLTKGDDE